MGSSGSGKTTLLRCLNFLETAGHRAASRVNGEHHVGRRRPRHPAGERDPQKAAPLRAGVPELSTSSRSIPPCRT
ncbi:MAG: hypothetical protein ACLVJH_15625 [Faecalibacterium prausnitzii]